MPKVSFELLDVKRQWEKPFLSVSSVRRYLRCPWEWQYRYVERAPMLPRSEHLKLGSTIHFALEWAYRYHMLFGLMPPFELMKKLVDIGLEKNGPWRPSDLLRFQAELTRFMGRYFGRMANVAPRGVEIPFLLEGPDELRVFGKVDLATFDGVYDFKLTWHPLDRQATATDDQLSFYAMVHWLGTGQWPREVAHINLVRSSGEVELRPKAMDHSMLDSVTHTFVWVRSAINQKRFDPTPGPHCKRCDFFSRCPYRQDPKLVAGTGSGEQNDPPSPTGVNVPGPTPLASV